MSDGYMSSWKGAAFDGEYTVFDEETSASKLPAINISASTLVEIRRALLFARPGTNLGVISGHRSSLPEERVCFDSFVTGGHQGIRPSTVVIPIGLTLCSRLPWRSGFVGGDSSLLKLFRAVASPVLLDEGQGIRVRIRVALPKFRLTCWKVLGRDSSPRIADVSLGIVLHGGDTAREGEHVGFLVQDRRHRNVVEPVYMNDIVGRRAIVGVWVLCKRDIWAATAVFAAESMTARNLKLGRPSGSNEDRRVVKFLVAQFHERAGGQPDFIPCAITLPLTEEPRHAVFNAQISVSTAELSQLGNQALVSHFVEEITLSSQIGKSSLQSTQVLDTTALGQRTHVDSSERKLPASFSNQTPALSPDDGQGLAKPILADLAVVHDKDLLPQRSTIINSSSSDEDEDEDEDEDKDGQQSGTRKDITPVSNAKAYLRDMARQVERLRADLRDLPISRLRPHTDEEEEEETGTFAGQVLRDHDSLSWRHDSLELSVGKPLSTEFLRRDRKFSTNDTPVTRTSIPRIITAADHDTGPSGTSPQSPRVRDEIVDARLHQLAKKYLGLDYSSSFCD